MKLLAAKGAASVAVTVPRVPPSESVTVTVLLVLPAWVRVKAALPVAEPFGVKAVALSQVAVAVLVPQ